MEGRAFLNTSNSNRDPSSAVARTSCSCSKMDRLSAWMHLIKLCYGDDVLRTLMCEMQSSAFWWRSVLAVMKANLHARTDWPSSSNLE